MRAAKNNKNIELISLHRRLYICFRFLRKQKPIPSKELLSAVLKSRLKDFFPGTWHVRNTPRWVIFSVCAGNSFAQTTNLCCLQGTILRWKNLMNNIFPPGEKATCERSWLVSTEKTCSGAVEFCSAITNTALAFKLCPYSSVFSFGWKFAKKRKLERRHKNG